MSATPRDKARQFALLKSELLAAARQAVDKLTDDQCVEIYVGIEERLARANTSPPAEPASQTSLTAPVIVPPTPRPTPTPELPLAEAKRHAAESVELDYLTRLMAEAEGCVTAAAESAGIDRTNFRRRLQRAGLRAPGKKKPGLKHTDQILNLLGADRTGIRASEIARRLRMEVPNVFSLLKYLERRERIQRHGEHHNTLWTLPGVEPIQRIDTIPAIIVDVLASNGPLPMDRRLLETRVEKILRGKGREFNAATLRSETTRLIEKGVVAFHGANEHGAMFALTVPLPEGGSTLN